MAVRKTKKGANLKRWFKEKWTDEKGNPCGSAKRKGVKKCRPSVKNIIIDPGNLGPDECG